VTARASIAVATRVLRQLRHDPRTLVLVVGVPCLLEALLKELFARRPDVFQGVGAPLLGLFPFVTMFLVASITMLRERTTGTLERLMSLPLAKADLLAGYGTAFALLAAVQASAASAVAFGPLGLEVDGSRALVGVLAIANALLGAALGLCVSAFARTEFQAVQFMPALVFPQILLSGLFVPRSSMAGWLRGISDALPLTYAYDALARTAAGRLDRGFAVDAAVVGAAVVVALALGAASLRRRTP
jgi:ABC-2 type transport system permease protein